MQARVLRVQARVSLCASSEIWIKWGSVSPCKGTDTPPAVGAVHMLPTDLQHTLPSTCGVQACQEPKLLPSFRSWRGGEAVGWRIQAEAGTLCCVLQCCNMD